MIFEHDEIDVTKRKMRKLKIIFLFVCFFQPIAIRSLPIKGISDFKGELTGVERIDFVCPFNNERKIKNSNDEFNVNKSKKICWVDFYPTYINIMDQQVINRIDVIRFFQSPPASGKCCASWNLIYRDKEEKIRMLSIRRNDIPFPLTKRKLKRLGSPANIINRWLVQ